MIRQNYGSLDGRISSEPVKTHQSDGGGVELQLPSPTRGHSQAHVGLRVKWAKDHAMSGTFPEVSGLEKLQRHRIEIAGRVWIPEIWGQEELMKDWIDCETFDRTLVPKGIMSARQALVEECRRANSSGLRIENPC
eukprot:TRINITY_DN160_c0_g2_i1.p1 TRINITY_DN160_c0_g2~~TRINITY_DN160_c0_g2_i1.p1  ORF type:complete len:136 (-),score=12.85 TRINITY_DN160_c0_g2_i1:115-522(-)